jgi:rod shape-determining protein MreD
MTIDFLKRCLLFLILCLVQALVFNRIQLFGCAMSLLYVYFVVTFRHDYPQWLVLLWSFLMGLTVDMFANTPGVASMSLTLLAALQPYLLSLVMPRDVDEVMHTSAAELGWPKFFTYSALMTLIYCLVFFTVEAFNFFNWQHWLMCVVGSTVLTQILVVTLESVRK